MSTHAAENAIAWAQKIEAIFCEEEQPNEPDYQVRRVAEIVLKIQEEVVLKTVAAIASNTIDVRTIAGRQ